MRGWRRSLFRFYNLGGVGSEEVQFEAAGTVGGPHREVRIYSQKDHSHTDLICSIYISVVQCRSPDLSFKSDLHFEKGS